MLSHLPPSALSDVSLVSHRFHQLVTTPHAWRIAFSRFFPGIEALSVSDTKFDTSGEERTMHAERREFTRLTALASWRSEYILRTRLLRSLGRGKPADASELINSGSSRAGASANGSAHVTYNSDLITIVDRIHATFGNGYNKKLPRFIHGATDVGMASSSDPKTGKVDPWGFADAFGAQHFADVYPGDDLYGLGSGDLIGVPNSMDVSQLYGMIYAEGLPEGRAYFRSTEEKRGRILSPFLNICIPEIGIPSVLPAGALSSAWIAKSSSLPALSEGLVGMLVGSSHGILSSYSLGTNPLHGRRLERGELTARWVLSPGVPIIAIALDDNFSSKRQASQRIWAIALNALGEVFYLSSIPVRRTLERASKLDDVMLEKLAWETGRSVYWTMLESSKRKPRLDPFVHSEPDLSYMLRTSWTGSGLSKEQLIAETNEIGIVMKKEPRHFRKTYQCWDMRQRLEVDFAASGETGIGENIIVISCGLDEETQAAVKRFTRCTFQKTINKPEGEFNYGSGPIPQELNSSSPPDLGNVTSLNEQQPKWSFKSLVPAKRGSAVDNKTVEEWRVTNFLLGGLKSPQVTTTAIDMSNFAILTASEDPLLSVDGMSVAPSPMSSPLGRSPLPSSKSDIPGQRARLLAVGTKSGVVILWNMRAPVARNVGLENSVEPIRIIHTDSPQISCLALTALYVVHGGNDGLVQAWDPLASSTDPIRTLNSRFSSRARRRLVQAEASSAGIGINLFAAGSICLDPDPTKLRGMVSLGSHLRYFSYSSRAADQYKGSKRRLRRSERGSNQGADRFSGTGRGTLKDYIANEKLELEREKRIRREEEKRLAGRYGVDLLGPGATEDEIMAYATLLSEEAARDDDLKRKSSSDDSSSDTVTEEAVASPASSTREELVDEMAEAIRLSLQESNGFRVSNLGGGDASASSYTVRYAKSKRSSPSRTPRKDSASFAAPCSIESAKIPEVELRDLDYALHLSQAEEESRVEGEVRGGKGKERAL